MFTKKEEGKVQFNRRERIQSSKLTLRYFFSFSYEAYVYWVGRPQAPFHLAVKKYTFLVISLGNQFFPLFENKKRRIWSTLCWKFMKCNLGFQIQSLWHSKLVYSKVSLIVFNRSYAQESSALLMEGSLFLSYLKKCMIIAGLLVKSSLATLARGPQRFIVTPSSIMSIPTWMPERGNEHDHNWTRI